MPPWVKHVERRGRGRAGRTHRICVLPALFDIGGIINHIYEYDISMWTRRRRVDRAQFGPIVAAPCCPEDRR